MSELIFLTIIMYIKVEAIEVFTGELAEVGLGTEVGKEAPGLREAVVSENKEKKILGSEFLTCASDERIKI